MTAAIYQCGDTIKIIEQFYSFAGSLTDLSANPTVKVYKPDKTTTVTTAITVSHVSTGIYAAVVTLPTDEGIYYIEFAGTAADGTAIRHAEAYTVKFSSST